MRSGCASRASFVEGDQHSITRLGRVAGIYKQPVLVEALSSSSFLAHHNQPTLPLPPILFILNGPYQANCS
jgi:hypothetical protein